MKYKNIILCLLLAGAPKVTATSLELHKGFNGELVQAANQIAYDVKDSEKGRKKQSWWLSDITEGTPSFIKIDYDDKALSVSQSLFELEAGKYQGMALANLADNKGQRAEQLVLFANDGVVSWQKGKVHNLFQSSSLT